MKYLLASDLHLADPAHAPASCTENYTEELFGLLAQMRRVVINDEEIRAVILAGDIFHLKAPTRNSHRLVQYTISALSHFRCRVYIVPGNHDMQHDRMDSIMLTQPLGVIFRSGAAQPLVGWMPGDEPVYGVPWLQHWTDEAVSEALAAYRERDHGMPWNSLVVAHAPLYPPGQELKFEHYPASSFAAAMGDMPVHHCVFYGHVHERHGEFEAGLVRFCNNGALSRGSLHEYNLTRQPACTIWDSTTAQFERVDLQGLAPEQLFRLEEHQQVTDMRGRLDEFLSGVGQATLATVSAESVAAHLATLDLMEGDRELAMELLTEAGARK